MNSDSPDPIAERRDEVLKRMLNTPPKPRANPTKEKARKAMVSPQSNSEPGQGS